MADLGSTLWTEVDSTNNATPPDGWPEGMAPSNVNNSARAEMGGEKRFWVRSNSVFTTAGTTTAYTLTYGQAATAYYDGEEFSFIVNATCGAAPTLNINALGARNIRKFTGGAYANIVAGDIVANQQLRVRYNLAATTFDIVSSSAAASQAGWQIFGTSSPSAVSVVDFISIPSTVNHLQCFFDFKTGTSAVSINLQTYGADGILDTGASDYYWNVFTINTSGGSSVTQQTTNAMAMAPGGIDNTTAGFGGDFIATNIQAPTFTKFNFRNNYQNAGNGFGSFGYGTRVEADRITGVRILVASGTFTGKATLMVST